MITYLLSNRTCLVVHVTGKSVCYPEWVEENMTLTRAVEYLGVGISVADGMRRRSWSSDELHAASDLLARGAPDAVDEEGNIIPQQMGGLGISSVLWGALRELEAECDKLRARIEVLEAR